MNVARSREQLDRWNSDKDENCQSFGARAMPLPVVGVSEMWCGRSVMRVGRWRPQAQLFDLKRWGVSSLSRRTIKYLLSLLLGGFLIGV